MHLLQRNRRDRLTSRDHKLLIANQIKINRNGEMTEWLKVRAWKVRIPQKGIVGSNPAFSAKLM